jgi:hypothetical protein
MPFGDNGRFNPKASREVFFVSESYSQSFSADWKSFVIPKNASMVMLLCVGGGGAGGAGQAAATSTAKGGGSGGGSGGSSRLIIPARFLPGTLFVNPGIGGQANGQSATSSYVSIIPTSGQNAPNFILSSGSSSASGGNVGASSGAATGGTGESVTAPTSMMFAGLGILTTVAGQNGGAGGNAVGPTAGGNVTWGAGGMFNTAGAGGGASSSGNSPTAGGNITGSTYLPSYNGGAGVAGGPGGAGLQGGNSQQHPLISWGGSGGGAASTAGAGGAGGVGGYGCGGGGGGAGVSAGVGGLGGPGFVYIAWW